MPGTGGSPGALGAGEVTAEASPGGDLAPRTQLGTSAFRPSSPAPGVYGRTVIIARTHIPAARGRSLQ